MIPRDLPYNENVTTKTHCENTFQFISTQIPYTPLENHS